MKQNEIQGQTETEKSRGEDGKGERDRERDRDWEGRLGDVAMTWLGPFKVLSLVFQLLSPGFPTVLRW